MDGKKSDNLTLTDSHNIWTQTELAFRCVDKVPVGGHWPHTHVATAGNERRHTRPENKWKFVTAGMCVAGKCDCRVGVFSPFLAI